MSQSDDNVKKLIAELFAQPQQQVPPGNPIAEYLGAREQEHRKSAQEYEDAAGGKLGLALALMGGGAALTPYSGLGLPMVAGGAVTKFLSALDRVHAAGENVSADEKAIGRNMWAERFGPDDQRHGYPGTQSGMGRVDSLPDWITGRNLTPVYMAPYEPSKPTRGRK